MFHVNLGDYFRVAILCDEIDKNHCTMISPGLGRETDGEGQETGSDLNGDKFSSLFPCEASVYCTVCVRPIRGPAGLGIDQSEARLLGSFPNSVCVLSHQRARQPGDRKNIANHKY